MLLPAVQAAREAARRSTCSNNIRQLSLGLHNFESTQKRLPNVAEDPILSSKGIDRTGYLLVMLPYIEQQAVYDSAIALGVVNGNIKLYDAAELRVNIAALLCPSDGNAANWQTGRPCQTSYRGSRADLAVRTNFEAGQYGSETAVSYATPRAWLRNGPFYWNNGGCPGGTTATLAMVKDGTSNSVMFSEGIIFGRTNSTTPGGDPKAKMAVGVSNTGIYTGTPANCLAVALNKRQLNADQATALATNDNEMLHQLGVRAFDWYVFNHSFYTLLPPNSPSCSPDSATGWVQDVWVSASSNHPGGVTVSMLDASARFISDTINTANLGRASISRERPQDADGYFSYGVWSELGSINGGESTAAP